MNMKIGSVYKVQYDKKRYAGMKNGKEQYDITKQEMVGIVVEIGKHSDSVGYYKFIATNGVIGKVHTDEVKQTSSVRLSKEVRGALKQLYKQFIEKEKLQQEIKKMESDLRDKRNEFDTHLDVLKKLSGEFQVQDIAKEFRSIRSYSTNPDKRTFSFYVEKDIARYANSDGYDFLSEEYDGTVYIDDHEGCIKRYGLTISKSEIETLKKQLKHTTLDGVRDGCEVGDKRTVSVNKIFDFTIKKGVKYEDMLQEGKRIEEWVARQKRIIGA